MQNKKQEVVNKLLESGYEENFSRELLETQDFDWFEYTSEEIFDQIIDDFSHMNELKEEILRGQ